MSDVLQSKGMKDSLFRTSMRKSGGTGTGAFDDSPPARMSSDMREVFQESYGIEMDLPGYYYFNSKFVPREFKNQYIVVLAWHIVPTGKNKKV